MLLFVLAGAAGVVLHYRGNMAFQLEMDPSQSGWTLFNKVIRANAPPAMAPAAWHNWGSSVLPTRTAIRRRLGGPSHGRRIHGRVT